MRNNYAASTYAKPGPLPIIPLPFHFGQDHCLKVRQEFLHHKVAQDLYGQKIKMTCSHIVLPLETEHLHDRMMCKCRQPLIYNGFTNIQWLHKHTMASPSQLPGGLHFKYQVCLRETQCISSEAFSTASLWETTQPLTTEELRCWTKMPIQFFCTLLWNCHVKTNGVKNIHINRVSGSKTSEKLVCWLLLPQTDLVLGHSHAPRGGIIKEKLFRESSDKGCF